VNIPASRKRVPFFSRAVDFFKSRFVYPGPSEINEITYPVVSNPMNDSYVKKRYEKSGLNEEILTQYERLLISHVEKSKIFLNPELTLEALSSQIKIPKHHITQLLNDRIRMNFYGFINSYRIREAMKKMKDSHQSVNLISLAFDCGFNSKSSFNNYFKKIMHETPSSYRQKHANLKGR